MATSGSRSEATRSTFWPLGRSGRRGGQELTAAAWPDTFVEESNLRVHIAGIKRALSDGQSGNRYVITVPGRDYRFVAPVSLAQELPELPPAHAPRIGNLPPPRTRMIGRSNLVSTLAARLMQRRFLTLVGPGSVGKTTVAMAVAGEMARAFRDGVAFVDLAPVADPRLVPSALSAVLGLRDAGLADRKRNACRGRASDRA